MPKTRASFAVLGIFSLFFLAGCEVDVKAQADASKKQEDTFVLAGEHSLRKMMPAVESKETKTSGSFFLIMGGVNSETKTSLAVRFAWQLQDGSYAISSLPLEKFRVKLDPQNTAPTIKFRWRSMSRDGMFGYYCPSDDLQCLMEKGFVSYAIVICKPEDWPTGIQLPMNK